MAESQIYFLFGHYKGIGMMAVLSRGMPGADAKDIEPPPEVLAAQAIPSLAEAEVWRDRMLIERPWEKRNDNERPAPPTS